MSTHAKLQRQDQRLSRPAEASASFGVETSAATRLAALQRLADDSPQVRQLRALQQMTGSNAPLQAVWNRRAGPYFTHEKCTLRADDEDHSELAQVAADSAITVVHPLRQKEFRRYVFKQNHVWCRHNGQAGWLREDAIGRSELIPEIDTYADNKIGNLPLHPTQRNFVHPDRAKYLNMKPRLRLFLAGVDSRQAPLGIVKKIISNIIGQNLFTYMATASDVNYLSGASTTGDCETLSKSIHTLLTDVLGIPGVTVMSKMNQFRINNQKPILTGMGVNRVDHWEFAHHYWLDVNGTQYDVLFNAALDQSDWVDM